MTGKALQREYAIAQKAGAMGVPIPEMLGFEAGPPAVLAMKQVIGRPLSSRYPCAAKEAGRYLQRFHTIGAHPPFSGGHQQWAAFISWWVQEETEKVMRHLAEIPWLLERGFKALAERNITALQASLRA